MRFSQTAQRCQLSPIRKFYPFAAAAEASGKKIYHLNIGQPDIPTPPAFFDAVRNFRETTVAYAPSEGVPELNRAIADYYRRIGVACDPEDVLVTTGGSEALLLAFFSVLDPGDEVMVPEPYYSNYATFCAQAGAVIRPVTTTPESGYHYAETEKLERALTDRTRVILLTNPGNPSGTVLTREEMRLIADFAVKHDLVLIVDEVYREFVYEGERLLSFGQIEGIEDRLILVDSVSKRFSACGARVGCLISRNRDLIAHALKFCQARLSVATLEQAAAKALYDVDPGYFDTIRDEYKLRRDTVVAKLEKIPGVVCRRPGGAFYMMAKLPVEDAEDFQMFLLREFSDHGETVLFSPGESFYATPGLGRSEIRIAYVLKQRDLERAMDLLALGLEAYRNR